MEMLTRGESGDHHTHLGPVRGILFRDMCSLFLHCSMSIGCVGNFIFLHGCLAGYM